MATVRAKIRVEIAGRTVRGFPLSLDISCDSFQTADYVRLFENAFAAFPGGQIDDIKLFLAKVLNTGADFRFGGQTDAVGSEADAVPLLEGGIVAVLNGAMTTTPKVRRYDAADTDETNATIVGVTAGAPADAA